MWSFDSRSVDDFHDTLPPTCGHKGIPSSFQKPSKPRTQCITRMANDAMKVRRSGPGGEFALEGVVDSNSSCEVKTVDSGIEKLPSLRAPDGTLYGFASCTIGTTTRSLDDFFSDAYASGTNNAIIPIIAQRSITLSADSANGAVVRVGNSATSTTVGFPHRCWRLSHA